LDEVLQDIWISAVIGAVASCALGVYLSVQCTVVALALAVLTEVFIAIVLVIFGFVSLWEAGFLLLVCVIVVQCSYFGALIAIARRSRSKSPCELDHDAA
jgi:hypothetical protein